MSFLICSWCMCVCVMFNEIKFQAKKRNFFFLQFYATFIIEVFLFCFLLLSFLQFALTCLAFTHFSNFSIVFLCFSFHFPIFLSHTLAKNRNPSTHKKETKKPAKWKRTQLRYNRNNNIKNKWIIFKFSVQSYYNSSSSSYFIIAAVV